MDLEKKTGAYAHPHITRWYILPATSLDFSSGPLREGGTLLPAPLLILVFDKTFFYGGGGGVNLFGNFSWWR